MEAATAYRRLSVELEKTQQTDEGRHHYWIDCFEGNYGNVLRRLAESTVRHSGEDGLCFLARARHF